MRPDLDAIRKKWEQRNIVDGNDVPTLLAYIAELEARTTYTVGETEWANRIAHAEARFVEEYDMRKAAERQVEELRARIVTLEAKR
jgi:hypothetical protein